MTGLRTRTVPLAEVTDGDRERWQALADRALQPNPFLDPAFLHRAHAWMPKAADIRIVVVEDSDAMRALLPVSIRARSPRLPLGYATTAGPFLRSFAPHLVPLVDRDGPEDALDGLLTHLAGHRSGLPGLVELTLFPGAGPLHDMLRESAARRRTPLVERYRFERAVAHLDRREDWKAGLSGTRRKSIRRYTRRLSAELGEIAVQDRGADPEAFEELVRLEGSGWKGDDGGYALQRSPQKLAWYREMVGEFRTRGQLHIIQMSAGGRTVYMSLYFRAGDRLFSTIDAYDENVAHLRPGNVGRAAELDYFQERGEGLIVDPCMHPRYRESSAAYPDREPLVGLLLAPRGLRSKAALRAVPLVRRARGLGRRAAPDGQPEGATIASDPRSAPELETGGRE